MASLAAKWSLLGVVLVASVHVIRAAMAPAADPCDEGCFVTHEFCDSPSVYKKFAGSAVALDTFWDPETDPDQYADIVKKVYETDWIKCQECRCEHIDCGQPCTGVHLGGIEVKIGDVLMTTECSDPPS